MKKYVAITLALTLGLFGVACGDDDTTTSSGGTSNATVAMNGALGDSLTAMSQALAATGSESQTMQAATLESFSASCDGGGTVTAEGTYTDTTLDMDMTFADCGETNVDGAFGMDMTFAQSGDTYTIAATIDALLSDDNCSTIDMDLTMDITLSGSSSSGTLGGTMSATCGSDSVSCTFSDVDLSSCAATLANSCS